MPRYLPLIAIHFVAAASQAAADDVYQLLQPIKAVDARGSGHPQAIAAVKQLSQSGPESLLPILVAMDDANPLAANWLRGAFESIADRALRSGAKLPAGDLEDFVLDRAHDPHARRLAYEWLAKVDPAAPDRIIPDMLDDPSAEMRRDAVDRSLSAAQKLLANDDKTGAKAEFERALSGAVDGDQVATIAKALADLGEEVNLVAHFGLLTEWRLIGPFDNKAGVGFAAAYPPEEKVDLTAEYDGQLGKVRWERFHAAPLQGDEINMDTVGLFNIAQLTKPHKGAVTYGATEFHSDRGQEIEFRLSTQNAWKLWLNGEFLFGQEEYHRGNMFDQYSVRGRMKPGKNTILLKVCQNEQTQDWAQTWGFQFRVCDLSGRGLRTSVEQAAASRSQ
jgi:hypothetical protein